MVRGLVRETPSYLAMANDLARTITRARPGTRLPSEHELARAHGFNRQTARAALQELERRHLVRRVQGRGTFVAAPIEYRVGRDLPPSWSETVRRGGAEPRTETERVRRRRATQDVRSQLALPTGAEVHVLARRRYVDGQLVGWAVTHVDAQSAPDLPERLHGGASLYRTLADQYGLDPVRAWFRAAMEIAPAHIGRRLGDEERPWTIATSSRTDCARSGRPIEVTRGWLRADVFKLVVELEWR